MHFEELSKYIFPLLFLLYFLPAKKKKKLPMQQTGVSLPTPPRSPEMQARSVSQRKLPLESAITSRRIPDRIEQREYVPPISDERAQALVSAELSEHISDPAYALKPRQRTSRGRAILNQLSNPRDAFILQVIINRYDSESKS